MFVLQMLLVPETFAPVLLRHKARELSKRTGRSYIAASDWQQPVRTVKQRFQTSLTVPFRLLFCEPIVILISCVSQLLASRTDKCSLYMALMCVARATRL